MPLPSEKLVHAVGFYPWKRRLLRTFRPAAKIKFLRSIKDLPQHAGLDVATWGTIFSDEEFPQGTRITRYEDGFIRSVGLGAKFTPALSWVVDRRGIYYDATRRSDLEDILQHEKFAPPLLQRARRLRDLMVKSGVTKYNLSGPQWTRPAPEGRIILVPGQVESDASIALGTRSIRTNRALLQTVRTANPRAFVVYKPHPDVVAGLRKRGDGESSAAASCDTVVTSAPIHTLIEAVDEVHVMTSLTGFEALLRGKRVVTYGQPFYAGWGLTEDMDPPQRRTRRLELDELVAGALIRYPLYRSPSTGNLCKAEEAINDLGQGRGALSYSPLESALRMLQHLPFWSRLLVR